MTAQLIDLHNEVLMMEKLRENSFTLIKSTISIQPIKKIIEIHDLIDLNLTIAQQFKDYKDAPLWDIAALCDMNRNRCEIMVFHHNYFSPRMILEKYNMDLVRLFNVISMRLNRPIIKY